jgi:hypothetical protein
MKEAGGRTALTCTPQSVTAALDDTDYWIVAYRKFDPSSTIWRSSIVPISASMPTRQ